MKQNKLPSEYISEFLDFIRYAQSHYKFCNEEMDNRNKVTQDYLHMLELDGLNYKERGKIATKLTVNQKDRRYYKDRVEELEHIVNWVSDPTNKRAVDMLSQILGATRKSENYHKDRTYKPRILKVEKEDNM